MAVVGLRRDLGAGRWPGPGSSRCEWLLSRSNWLSPRDRSQDPFATMAKGSLVRLGCSDTLFYMNFCIYLTAILFLYSLGCLRRGFLSRIINPGRYGLNMYGSLRTINPICLIPMGLPITGFEPGTARTVLSVISNPHSGLSADTPPQSAFHF